VTSVGRGERHIQEKGNKPENAWQEGVHHFRQTIGTVTDVTPNRGPLGPGDVQTVRIYDGGHHHKVIPRKGISIYAVEVQDKHSFFGQRPKSRLGVNRKEDWCLRRTEVPREWGVLLEKNSGDYKKKWRCRSKKRKGES